MMFARLEGVEHQIRMQGRVCHWKNKTMQINILRLKQIVHVPYKETLPHIVALRYVLKGKCHGVFDLFG